MNAPNRYPLPNLSTPAKVFWTALLAAAILVFAGSWIAILYYVYGSLESQSMTVFGAELGALASRESASFKLLLALHIGSMLLLLALSFELFQKTSIRRRVRWILTRGAVVLAILDLTAWLYAPSCTSTNLIVGYIGLISALPLVFLAAAPIYQMWVYTRWQNAPAERKRVLIVGGGFGGLYTALKLNKILGYHPSLEIVLIDQRNYFLFPPLLPSAAAGTIETRQVSFPFRRVFETTNVRFSKVCVTRIDPANRRISGLVETRRDSVTGELLQREISYDYDYLVFAPGSAVQTYSTQGVAEYSYFMRELNDAIVLRNRVIELFEQSAVVGDAEQQRRMLRFVVIGAGPTGIETATEIFDLIHLVLHRRYPEIDPAAPSVVIVQSGNTVLPGWDPDIQAMAVAQLEKTGIAVRFGERVSKVGPDYVIVGSDRIEAYTVIWCAGVKSAPLTGNAGLPLDEKSGRIPVEQDLRVKQYPEVFVLGDVAQLDDPRTGKAYPALAQVALQQGNQTGKNISRVLMGQPTEAFSYLDYGGLVSVGEHFAAVNLKGVKLKGFIGWLVWRTLYLAKLPEFSNKVRILSDWLFDLLIERSISQIRDPERPAAG